MVFVPFHHAYDGSQAIAQRPEKPSISSFKTQFSETKYFSILMVPHKNDLKGHIGMYIYNLVRIF